MDFDMLGLAPRLVAELARQGMKDPTPIQAKAIPHAMNGRDVMGLAQTGTGKTAAFGLPLVHMLLGQGVAPAPKRVHGLILAPTRELARQICDHLGVFTKGTHLKVMMVVGGASINPQIQKLGRGADLLVATPGRLIDLLDRRAVALNETRFLVLDEADQMLDMGFIHALRRIAPLLPKDRQTMLFSATMPKHMDEIAAAYLTDPVRVQVSPPGKAVEKIEQEIHFVAKAEKSGLLVELLDKHRDEMALVFSRTKHGAEKLMKSLVNAGYEAASIHGNKSQGQRDRALDAFRAGQHQGAGGDGCGGTRHRHPRRAACLQLRPAERGRELRPPHRPHRARRGRWQGDRLLRARRDGRVEGYREGDEGQHSGGQRTPLGGDGCAQESGASTRSAPPPSPGSGPPPRRLMNTDKVGSNPPYRLDHPISVLPRRSLRRLA